MRNGGVLDQSTEPRYSIIRTHRTMNGQACAHTLDQSHRLFDYADGPVTGS
jgi:hypothetical protein